MNTLFLSREIDYNGAQLVSGWIRNEAGLEGDAAVAFLGPCDVSPEHMVDTVDLDAGATIVSPLMLHFIVEHANVDLLAITLRQRLLIAIAAEIIESHLGEVLIRREGDDLYLRDRKLSVSVATTSPKTGLIHAGFNVRGDGAPVPAVGLDELGVEPKVFAELLLSAYAAEIAGASDAASKVKPVA